MGEPICLNIIEDLAIGASGVDILREQADAQLEEPSYVVIYLNRESVDVTAQIKIGTREVVPLGGAAINATVGDLPAVPTDRQVVSFGRTGERVVIAGTNANAAAQELRARVFIFAVSDIQAFPQILQNQ